MTHVTHTLGLLGSVLCSGAAAGRRAFGLAPALLSGVAADAALDLRLRLLLAAGALPGSASGGLAFFAAEVRAIVLLAAKHRGVRYHPRAGAISRSARHDARASLCMVVVRYD